VLKWSVQPKIWPIQLLSRLWLASLVAVDILQWSFWKSSCCLIHRLWSRCDLPTVVLVDCQAAWERWCLDDSVRAELPLTDDQDRATTFPRGFAISFNSKRQIPLSMFSSVYMFLLFWLIKKVKVAHTWLPIIVFQSWSQFLAVSLQVTWVINPVVGCHYFPPGPQLPSQPLRELIPFRCFVNWGTMGVNSLPKTATRQHRSCDLNTGPSAPESSMLTTQLPSWVDYNDINGTETV